MTNSRGGFVPLLVLVVVAFAGIGGAGSVALAQRSLPGETFYKVKEITDQAKLALAFTPARKAKVYLKIADERLVEADRLQSKNADPSLVAETLNKYRFAQDKALELLGNPDNQTSETQEVVQQIKDQKEEKSRVINKVIDQLPQEKKDEVKRSIDESNKNRDDTIAGLPSGDSGGSSPTGTTTTSPISAPTPTVYVQPTPTYVPTSIPTSALFSTPTPTVGPTPTSVIVGTIDVLVVAHLGNQDVNVSGARIKIKSVSTGGVLVTGTADSYGRFRADNVSANQNVDVIGTQPSDWNSYYCGKWSTYLSAGGFKSETLRLLFSESSTCE
ncbi:MAG: hypothetical protein A2700_01095 [Candidatus Blackburnbacteria bacterium RIFCSPHIGHO2_01_FULL_44_64]|uniref:DUF5667 domain-containing protein n=1 Tax=Candidatus Blackburnbacteria bacterium RIFCSPHIGHO2_02_FULL_44_20 TaxID=1797516 RepID=A0A1G1V600_9BACT|nr:MAG: hypothetical protein A2700_01095 [Candidatus Blackburnbacteria bacterium RIFCSPHIGHO2_01_FULL_44_64]OGY10672.1 MAG: hypothetical protein A3D26_00730 [Candidatus Blackburnbacteria bacterium RIFCSPHIGHO2_02_FULL_44_20]OGY11065.1 MAG: hypothetical protein A3E16_04645 [Candidatus Blackburnbacteria bacterium RIFCSPHIGHO2_12_FULL_44_25]OGY13450.1 MAG: hypothetical protein A3A62_03015 [Candidatus Blackburnbacteria bacterium RIFCSPLOWO2_01_FULL_44_43]OGY16628.1 MAG: hypothetical protein A3H88_0